MTVPNVERVAVVGAGTIGLSWTALFAGHGLHVTVADPRTDLADAVAGALDEFIPHLAAQHLDVTGLRERVRITDSTIAAVRDADVVQENGPENPEFKKTLFAELLANAPAHALLLSSSSAIPSTAFTGELADASRILIGHPFNPPHLIPLVEVVPGERTSPESVERAVAFYRSLGRTPVVERSELPGFVGNRLQNALSREAIYLVEQGVVTPSELDTVITNSLGIRWSTVGPFLGSHLGGGPGGYRHMAAHIGVSMRRMWNELGTPAAGPEETAQLVRAVEKAYGDRSYTELTAERDRKQLAVLAALDGVSSGSPAGDVPDSDVPDSDSADTTNDSAKGN